MLTVPDTEMGEQFPALLDRVRDGEEVVITRAGKPVARLVPPVTDIEAGISGDELLERFKAVRENMRLDGLSWKELRDDGRP